jgi:uncharacterized protein (TIGR02452 family)
MSARLAAVAAQTVHIVHTGWYEAPDGSRVTIGDDVARAVAGTRLYAPDDPLPDVRSGPPAPPAIEVTTESTLEAGERLGPGAAALVFASARNPGGGFLSGAKAQEEDIARASALHECLLAAPAFYAYHRGEADLRYSDRVIYSPGVPVFRRRDASLLDRPYRLSFLTAAAPNLGAILTSQPRRAPTVPAALLSRTQRVLRVAAAHGHRDIVLGAWGCGVFRNSPDVVAAAFRTALPQVPHFDRVVFAVLDPAGDGPSYRAFVRAFTGEG